MPSPEQPDREKQIFEHALEIASAEERLGYLRGACEGDPALLERVEALLRAAESGADFLPETPKGPGGTVRIDLPPLEKPGDHIGRYKLLQQIGEGGCGVVYMAEQEEPVRRRVALKVIKLGMDTREVIARFEAERQALAVMDHPNIAKVLDAGATETGRPFFVMELVRGVRITDYCDQNNLSTIDRLNLFVQVCHAVQHAHQKGIIHRDIKPSNILVTLNDGVPMPKVIDFGIAKATLGKLTDDTVFTAFDQFIGTPAYMSPEQAEMSALDIDTRSDIYSLGVLLYELLTGETPFDAKQLLKAGLDEMRRHIREVEPARPSTRLSTMVAADLSTVAAKRHAAAPKLIHLVRGDLDWIVMKCLEKDRTRRYDTANGLALDLQRHLQNEPVLAGPPSAAYRLRKFVQRHRFGVVAGSLILLAMLAGIIGTTLSLREALRQKREAQRQSAIARETVDFLTGMFESIDPAQAKLRDITVREALESAGNKLKGAFPNDPLIELPIRGTMSDIYDKIGRDDEALTNAEAAYRLAKSVYGDKDAQEVAQSLTDLSKMLDADGRVTEALPRAEEALAMWQRLYPGDNRYVAGALAYVGDRLGVLSRPQEALPKYEASLAMWRRLTNGDDVQIAKTIEYGALTLNAMGRSDAALTNLQAALAMRRRLTTNDDPEIADNISDQALCLDALGRPAEALPKYEEALEMLRRIYRGDHPKVGRSINDMALSLYHMGRAPEALTNWQAALEMARRMYPGDHQDLAYCLDNVAQCLEAVGRPAEALPYHVEVLAMVQRIYKGDHPEVAKNFDNLATGLSHLGRNAEALTNYETALEMLQRLNHGDEPSVDIVLNNVAECCDRLGRSEEGLPRHEEALAMARRLYKGDNPTVAQDLNNLAHGLQYLKRYQEALTNYQAALDMSRRLFPGDDLHLVTLLSRIGDTLDALQRSDEAMAKYDETIAMGQRLAAAQPQNMDWQLSLAASFGKKGDLSTKQGKEFQAKESYQNGLQIIETVLTAQPGNSKAATMRDKFRLKPGLKN